MDIPIKATVSDKFDLPRYPYALVGKVDIRVDDEVIDRVVAYDAEAGWVVQSTETWPRSLRILTGRVVLSLR